MLKVRPNDTAFLHPHWFAISNILTIVVVVIIVLWSLLESVNLALLFSFPLSLYIFLSFSLALLFHFPRSIYPFSIHPSLLFPSLSSLYLTAQSSLFLLIPFTVHV